MDMRKRVKKDLAGIYCTLCYMSEGRYQIKLYCSTKVSRLKRREEKRTRIEKQKIIVRNRSTKQPVNLLR
jgi:hypothetical protein